MDYSYSSSSGGQIFIEIVGLLLALLLLGILYYRILTKMGYVGATRWVLLVTGFFPVTGLMQMIWFAFFPWPSLKELRELKKRIERLNDIGYNPLDAELDRLRQEMMRKRKEF